ncbi:MAG: hypothetical protein AB7P17_09285 [Nitrospirales bacterium]
MIITIPSLVKAMLKRPALWCVLMIAGNNFFAWADTPVDDLQDLTGGVVPIVQYKGHDPFSGRDLTSVSQIEYEVRVKNQTGDPVVADSLILVIDGIQEISGKDISEGIDIDGYDGTLQNGKLFFRIPSSEKELPPFGESEPVTIRVNNPNYLRFYPPRMLVKGIRRSPNAAVKDLLESLMQKGILHPEEAAKALESAGEGTR